METIVIEIPIGLESDAETKKGFYIYLQRALNNSKHTNSIYNDILSDVDERLSYTKERIKYVTIEID